MAYNWLDLQVRAHAEFSRGLDAVVDWSAPTPDTEWDVAALVRHVIEEQQWVPALLGGLTIDEAGGRIEPLGDDLAGEWRRHSAAATDAWARVSWAGAAGGTSVQLSYDTVTAEDYLREQVSDVVIHSWDLARAVGADERLDGLLVQATWTIFEPLQDTLAASGLYAHAIKMPDDAPLQARLLAITGRDPR